MAGIVADIIKTALESEGQGQGKRLSLGDAVARYVKPGMTIHLAAGIGGPSAAICEIIRQFHGKNPQLTVIQSTLAGHALNLVHCGVVKKLVCAICAEISAASRPSRIIQEAHESGAIELENWSLCSLQQRLMAGAFGFPFMPTRSVLGSSIAEDNRESFREMEDPFGSEVKTGIVKALNPDLSIVHGCVADAQGNTILAAPYGEDLWGPFASTGVIVTVEAIVPTEFIRRYAAMVKIPGNIVKAVCEAPLGLHPFSFPNPGITDFDPYEQDIDFLNELGVAFRSSATLDDWVTKWIKECATHQEYLDKLGYERIAALKQKAGHAKTTIFHGVSQIDIKRPFDSEEMMLIAVAREIRNSVKKSGHTMILAGAGTGATAAFLAYYQLKAGGSEIELVTGNGQIAYTPIPGKSILMTEAGVRSSKILSDTVMTQGVFVGGKNNKCLSILGAGQIDKNGDINSTKTSQGKFLVGSGGANDALNAREVILVLNQSKDRFVEKLSYVTGPGSNVTTVVSTMGIFRKKGPSAELELAACFPTLKAGSLAGKIEEVKSQCGWALTARPDVEEVPAPTEEELELLRWLLSSEA